MRMIIHHRFGREVRQSIITSQATGVDADAFARDLAERRARDGLMVFEVGYGHVMIPARQVEMIEVRLDD